MVKFILGHCSFENYDSEKKVLEFISENKHEFYRAMLWKPRTNPTNWQGIGEAGLEALIKLKKEFPQIKFVTEILNPNQYELVKGVVDVFQIGSRNSQNYDLLKFLGSLKNKTILYKRGFGMTIDEWIDGMEYLHCDQNEVIMCARGIRSFDTHFRFTPDLDAVIVLKDIFADNPNVFIGFDPSHSAGNSKYVIPLAKAALALDIDFLEIEIHQDPSIAITDKKQVLSFEQFSEIEHLDFPHSA